MYSEKAKKSRHPKSLDYNFPPNFLISWGFLVCQRKSVKSEFFLQTNSQNISTVMAELKGYRPKMKASPELPISVQTLSVKTTAVLLQNALLSPNFGQFFCYSSSVSISLQHPTVKTTATLPADMFGVCGFWL